MPITYNGIGTHYYGKKNAEQRVGACRACGAQAKLTSYDTRLWFVIIFIPIIPLGRKRIIDDCSACRRHFVLELDKWETAKQLGVSGCREKFRAQPSVETAIELHQTLIDYQELAEAAEFRASVQTQFADSAKFNAYLGVILSRLGKTAEAMPHFFRAHELRPDLPEARAGIALGRIQEGKLEEARALLDFLENPGAAQLHSLEPLELLADAFQKADRHAEALELYKRILDALPAVANHKGFRKKVAQSEKALKRPESILPKRKFSWRNWMTLRTPSPGNPGVVITKRGALIAAALAACVVLGLAISNEHIRRHRTLHLINGLNQPVEIEIVGVGGFSLRTPRASIALSEGKYRAVVKTPVRQEFDFELRDDYFSRWGSDSFWALNAGDAAILMVEAATYRRNPSPPTSRFFYGKPFIHIEHVTHPFVPLPASLSMRSGETRVLTRVEILTQPIAAIVRHLAESRRAAEGLRLAEWGLERKPADRGLLQQYVVTAAASHSVDQARSYLEAGLGVLPVRIEWHRAYQQLFSLRPPAPELVDRYTTLLQAEPSNASLLYLRGRTSNTRSESRQWFERAKQADPNNPYPHFALGYEDMISGDWREALNSFQLAFEASPDDEMFSALLGTARYAVGDYDRLIVEERKRIGGSPGNLASVVHLINALVAKGQAGEAETVESDYAQAMRRTHREGAATVTMVSRCSLFYALEKYAEMEKEARLDKSAAGLNFLTQALVEQGRLEEADKLHADAPERDADPYRHLIMSIAWRMQGDIQRSQSHWRQAKEGLGAEDVNGKLMARLLESSEPPRMEDIAEVTSQPSVKAILFTGLAMQYPAKAAEYIAMARKFNREAGYPRHLLERAHNKLSPP
ncbi:MAG: hypothetical protein HYR88_17975 [Verrucomicrobia bacterium]|nr:hypothetical protein [Verrucomicrobiota bacterium]MBI3868983.1 hypothetical protein [Verrucomicrobiota bacterium]